MRGGEGEENSKHDANESISKPLSNLVYTS